MNEHRTMAGYRKENHAYACMTPKQFQKYLENKFNQKSPYDRKCDSVYSNVEAFEDGKQIDLFQAIESCGGKPVAGLKE